MGSISTFLNASDLSSMVKGKLKFGNCYNKGYVVAYIDGVEIGRATAQEIKQVEFEFKHGSELKLSEFESGIIHFIKVEVIDCIQGMIYLKNSKLSIQNFLVPYFYTIHRLQ